MGIIRWVSDLWDRWTSGGPWWTTSSTVTFPEYKSRNIMGDMKQAIGDLKTAAKTVVDGDAFKNVKQAFDGVQVAAKNVIEVAYSVDELALRKVLIGTEVFDDKGRKYLLSGDPIENDGDIIYGIYGESIDICIAGFSDGSMVVAMKTGRAVLNKRYFLKAIPQFKVDIPKISDEPFVYYRKKPSNGNPYNQKPQRSEGNPHKHRGFKRR